MSSFLLGIDIGTSACKAALFGTDGALTGAADSAYSVCYPQAGWAEQDPELWWQGAVSAVRSVLSQTGINPADIVGIGIDGQSWAMIPIDAHGNVLCASPIWTDTRAREECGDMLRAVGREALFSCSGNPVTPSYTLPKVLWFRKRFPSLYQKTEKVLQSNSFIAYRLTGAVTQDVSQGYGWNCFDMARGVWNRQLARELGVETRLLPDIHECCEIIGRVTAEAAALTGLTAGTPVVAGGLDAACSALGVGVTQAGQTQEQGGQAGGMSICMETCAPNPALILSRHVIAQRWLLQGGTTGGGGALKWFREQFCPDMDFEQMSEAASGVPAGSDGVIFLPFMVGERSPLWNPDAKGVFYGLGFSVGRREMIRAVMEGVAYSLRHNLETAAETGGETIVMRSTGGSGKSPVWMQIKADVTGRRIEVAQAETAAARGAAVLAGLGTGVFNSPEDAAKGIKVASRYEPEEKQVYQRQYTLYRKLITEMYSLYR
ncbi:MAG: FGGY family carbohydrate kinase [Clostridiales bacterium]|nr:FGGY family carbohydrate kinase [Clostridiales bacterium]